MLSHRPCNAARRVLLAGLGCLLLMLSGSIADDEPSVLSPFGPKQRTRNDAIPGYVELSDGSLHVGKVYLTRDSRLQLFDEQAGRQREVPLSSIKRIDCRIEREWLEKEWRFKENANDEKVYTGRSYPARQYSHTLELSDGRQISGALSGIVYVAPYEGTEAERFLFHKRDKGPAGRELTALVYVRTVELGEEPMRAALQRRSEQEQRTTGRSKPK